MHETHHNKQTTLLAYIMCSFNFQKKNETYFYCERENCGEGQCRDI